MKKTIQIKYLLLLFNLVILTSLKAINPPTLNLPADGENYIDYHMNLSIFTVSGATKYIFEIDTNNQFNSPFKITDSITSLYYHPTILKYGFGKTYYWRVKAKNATEISNWSDIRTFSVQTQVKLDYPADNFISDSHGPYFRIHPFGTIISYYIEIDTVNTFNSPFFQVRYPTNSTPTVQALYMPYGKKIYWRAWAFNGWGDTSDYSEVRSLTIQAAPTLASPTNELTGVDTSVNYSVNFIKGGAQQTTIYLSEDPYFDVNVIYTVVSGKFKGLKFGTKYYWKARHTTNLGKNISEWSPVFTFTTKYQLSKPTITNPINNSSTNISSILIEWLAVTPQPVNGYYTELDTIADFTNPYSIYSSNTSVSVPSNFVENWRSAYIRVKGFNDLGNGPWSNTVKINKTSLSISNLAHSKSFEIFQTQKSLTIHSLASSGFKVHIYNTTGQLIQTFLADEKMIVPLDDFNKGLYVVHIESDSGEIIKQKLMVL
jgi:hypothetical protein